MFDFKFVQRPILSLIYHLYVNNNRKNSFNFFLNIYKLLINCLYHVFYVIQYNIFFFLNQNWGTIHEIIELNLIQKHLNINNVFFSKDVFNNF